MLQPLSEAAGDCHLNGWDGARLYSISLVEGQVLVRDGKAVRTSRTGFRLLTPPPTASASRNSKCVLTRQDLLALLGVYQMTDEQRERLIGYGVLPSPSGYVPLPSELPIVTTAALIPEAGWTTL